MTASRPPTTAEELRAAGLRATAARVALLETVRQGGHLGAEDLASEVRRRIGHVSLQAVYEALHALTGAGLVRRIAPAGGPARYGGRVGDNHHHLVCRSCGAVADVDCAVGDAPVSPLRPPRLRDRRGRGRLLGPVPRLFHLPQ
ncbi:hypothetical protein SHKM778_42030 [Streptomyces sp. KM77-8]|uniref:Transcriptional repressor n=1 Tax=Streptomyces haneummycinicus TaxID=3074435 RepID=A0AAT9HK73_9ACTN